MNLRGIYLYRVMSKLLSIYIWSTLRKILGLSFEMSQK